MAENQSDIRSEVQERSTSRLPFPDPFQGVFSLDHIQFVQGAQNFLGSIVNGLVGVVSFGTQGGSRTYFEDNVRLARYKATQNDVI